jgi:vacuolar-type H+-ATPase subunit H
MEQYATLPTEDLYNTLDTIKISLRKNYLIENGYDADECIKLYSEYKIKQYKDNKSVKTKTKATKGNFKEDAQKILEQPKNFTSVNFDTTNEPPPTFKYKDNYNEIEEEQQAVINEIAKDQQTNFIDALNISYPIQTIEPNEAEKQELLEILNELTNAKQELSQVNQVIAEATATANRIITSARADATNIIANAEINSQAERQIILSQAQAEAKEILLTTEAEALEIKKTANKLLFDAEDRADTLISRANHHATVITDQARDLSIIGEQKANEAEQYYKQKIEDADTYTIIANKKTTDQTEYKISIDIDEIDGVYHIMYGGVFIDIDFTDDKKEQKILIIKDNNQQIFRQRLK